MRPASLLRPNSASASSNTLQAHYQCLRRRLPHWLAPGTSTRRLDRTRLRRHQLHSCHSYCSCCSQRYSPTTSHSNCSGSPSYPGTGCCPWHHSRLRRRHNHCTGFNTIIAAAGRCFEPNRLLAPVATGSRLDQRDLIPRLTATDFYLTGTGLNYRAMMAPALATASTLTRASQNQMDLDSRPDSML